MKKNFARLLVAALMATSLSVALPAQQASAYSGSTGKGCTAYQYGYGGYSTCISYIQQMLNGINLAYGQNYGGSSLAVDASFGPRTKTQVQRFQKWTGLKVDGVVGPRTWQELCSWAGQVFFKYSHAGSIRNKAWSAAYNAGCYVERPTSGGIGYETISRY